MPGSLFLTRVLKHYDRESSSTQQVRHGKFSLFTVVSHVILSKEQTNLKMLGIASEKCLHKDLTKRSQGQPHSERMNHNKGRSTALKYDVLLKVRGDFQILDKMNLIL